jgi:hypothetical protein
MAQISKSYEVIPSGQVVGIDYKLEFTSGVTLDSWLTGVSLNWSDIDARLSAAPAYPIRLHPNEWQSGDVYWIVDARGERNAVQQCIEALTKTICGQAFQDAFAGGPKAHVGTADRRRSCFSLQCRKRV